jgi:hypothetical protein
MTTEDSITDRTDLVNRVTERFLIALGPGELYPELDVARDSLPAKYSDIAEAFSNNLAGVLSTVGMPFNLASAATEGSHLQRIFTAESIRALKVGIDSQEEAATPEVRHKAAFERASKRMLEFLSSGDGQDTIAIDVCRFLLRSLKTPAMVDAALELLLQGEVLTWSALEILARDLFETIVNSDPNRIKAILQDPVASKRLPAKFTLEELASFGFNISASLGSILSSRQDFSDLGTIRAVLLPTLDADSAVRTALADRRLWVLCQRRHLIVHRRGVIDARYAEATGDTSPFGTRLSVTPEELESHIQAVGVAGAAMLTAAGTHAA